MMKTLRLQTAHLRTATALMLVIVGTLLFASVVSGQTSPSEYPPPPPSPIAPPDWTFDNENKMMPLLGDVNWSDSVTVADARLLMQHVARIVTLDDDQIAVADINNSESLTVDDARKMMQYVARMPVAYWEFPADGEFRDPGKSNWYWD